MCSTLARQDPHHLLLSHVGMYTVLLYTAMTVECVEHAFVHIWYTKHYIYSLTCTIIQLVLEPGSGLVLPEWYMLRFLLLQWVNSYIWCTIPHWKALGHLTWPNFSPVLTTITLSLHATWQNAMSCVMYIQYNNGKRRNGWMHCAMKYSSILICVAKHCFSCVYNCSCLHDHSESEDASLPEFNITVTVIAAAATVVVVLAIAMATAVAIVVCALKRFVLISVSN